MRHSNVRKRDGKTVTNLLFESHLEARLRGWAPGGAGRDGVAQKGLAMVAEAPAEPSY